MENDVIDVDLGNKLVMLHRAKIGPINVINGTMTDITFSTGLILPAQDTDFANAFRAKISKHIVLDKEGVVIFSRRAWASKMDVDRVNDIMKQIPEDTFVIASVKTMNAFKHPRIIVAERDSTRLARPEFELSSMFFR